MGNLDVVQLLLEKGAKVDRADRQGNTPLWIASEVCFFFLYYLSFSHVLQKGHLEIVKFLFENGAKVDQANKRRETPLSIASYVCI